VITADAYQKIATGYVSAFFRWHLKNWTQWGRNPPRRGVPVPAAPADSKAKFHVQYEYPGARTVDNFERAHSATGSQASTIGGAVGDSGTLPAAPSENQLPSWGE
jgi:hypothetical protein